MRIDKWKCDKCGVEFEGKVHYHDEFDFCDNCHSMFQALRFDYDVELDKLREEKSGRIKGKGK